MLRMIDLFSGIGGFSYGLETLCGGFETVAFCEQNEYCQDVLRRHWPGVPIHDDIKTFPTNRYVGQCDVITGGFPCQPFSAAGKQNGKADDRYLWPEMLSIIAALRPTWVLGENVAGIVNMELDNVLSDLAAEGYAAQALVIPACAVDAKHKRARVWIVGHCDSAKRQRKSLSNQSEIRQENIDAGGAGSAMADAESKCRRTPGRQQQQKSCYQTRYASEWPAEPAVDRMVNGLSRGMGDTRRLKALGNSVVPQIVAEIGRAMLTAESHNEAA